MKILVTGSTSFLGSKFIQLYENNYLILGISKHDATNPVDILSKEKLTKIFNDFKPEVLIHTAALVDSNDPNLKESNIKGTVNLIDLAKQTNIPIVFTSSESVYGGKEESGNYVETDLIKPRSAYAETKAECEALIQSSGLNYLIIRAHRFVGINNSYNKPKQFPDALKMLTNGLEIHLDSHKLFKPCLINHISQIFAHYIEHDTDKKILINVGVDKVTNYFDFMKDVANTLGLNSELIKPDGEETGWPVNSTLSLEKMESLGYPMLSYIDLLTTLRTDWF